MRPYLLVGYRCNAGRPAAVKSLWGEPFGEGIPASLLRAFSFVRPPAQTAHTNCKRAKLSPILFPLFPHFKLHARFAYRYMFLHRCRNPFGGPALLATFHNCSVTMGANDKEDVNSNQIRRTEASCCQHKASRPEARPSLNRSTSSSRVASIASESRSGGSVNATD